jgi:hypothetical protein
VLSDPISRDCGHHATPAHGLAGDVRESSSGIAAVRSLAGMAA